MHGGGSLDRSLRSSGTLSDLKWAAFGAGVLLRERIAALVPARAKKFASKKPVERIENPPRIVVLVERYLPNRAGVSLTVLLLLGVAALGIVDGGHADAFVTGLSDSRNALANSFGFRIASVTINGRKQLSQDEILAVGGVNGRSSLLFLDAAAVRDKLKASPWIADATVLKLYPDKLMIQITERKPFAIWQQDGQLQVIAEDGAVLEAYVTRRFTSLPLVVGKGAATRAREFLALLDRYPQVRSVTKAAVFVGERRWNLRLNDGLDVRLPENDVGNALAVLTKLDQDDKLFSRDITAIDLRLPDRLTVRLSDNAAKAREDLLKAKQPKKKAGEA